MNTHNVNVNTATPESPKTWDNSPSAFWLIRKDALLVELAKAEGELMMYHALERAGVTTETEEREECPWDAAVIVKSLAEMGAINSPRVYEMARSVRTLAVNLCRGAWRRGEPPVLEDLKSCVAEAEAARNKLIAHWAEQEKPYCVMAHGETEYPEDDPTYGTYWREGVVHLGRAWTVAEAMDIAAAAWLEGEWEPRDADECHWDSDFGRDMGPVSFSPRTIVISDEQNRKVLTADAASLEWNAHVTGEAEISRLAAERDALLREAALESGWDNFSTTKQLRAKAEATQAGVVDSAWQGHPDVMDALAAFVRPERKTWGDRLNTRGLSKFMADDMKFLISLSERSCPASKNERYELVHGLALSIADHVSRAVTDWSTPRPKIPAAVIAAWLLTKEMVLALFGENGEEIWSGVQGALKSRLTEYYHDC